jgi:hypothetical protein
VLRLFPMAMVLDTPYEFFSDSSVVESFSRHSYRMTLLRLKKTLRSLLLLESFLGDSNLGLAMTCSIPGATPRQPRNFVFLASSIFVCEP